MSSAMSDYISDKSSLYSGSIQTDSEVPTTPPPEYAEDITPRASFSEDRDLDLTTVPGLEGLPSVITQPTLSHSELPTAFHAYASTSASSSGARGPLPAWNAYRIPTSSLSKDRTTVTTSDRALLTDVDILTEFIRAQAALPPVPEIRITGEHHGSSGKVSDFDLRLKLLRYIISNQAAPSSTSSVGLNYIRVRADDGTTRLASTTEGSDLTHVRAIAESFVKDNTNNKSLTLNRVVTNWDKAYLKGCVLSLLSDLRYRGNVTVSFPVSHSKVVVQPERTVADTFRSLMFFDKKKYEGIDAMWPYANEPPPTGEGKRAETNPARTFAVRSEQGWWNDWKGAIERAALEGRKGNVGVDDLLEIRLGFPGPEKKWRDWGTNAWGS